MEVFKPTDPAPMSEEKIKELKNKFENDPQLVAIRDKPPKYIENDFIDLDRKFVRNMP